MNVTVPLHGLTVDQKLEMIGRPVELTVNSQEDGPITLVGVLELLKFQGGLCYALFSGSVDSQTEITFPDTLTANFTFHQREQRAR